MIYIKNLSFSYNAQTVLFDKTSAPLNFFRPSRRIAIIGTNGSGKSTFLKLLIGQLKASEGSIGISKNIKFSYMPQQQSYDKTYPLTVNEVVSMATTPRLFFQKISSSDQDIIDKALAKTGLLHLKNAPISILSGGQFQRMLFARTYIEQSDLILLDEPFAAIDAQTTEDIIEMMKELTKENKTILCICHDLTLVHNHFDFICFVKNKNIFFYSIDEWHNAHDKKVISYVL